jgi:RNA polymerase sigma-70 factor (ECF subfamily)
MTADDPIAADLLQKALAGDDQALAGLFVHYRDRLERMVALRLDRRLQGRIDPADVLQDAYFILARRFAEYAARPAVPFFVWLRQLVGQKLIDAHRHHLGALARDAGQEVSLDHGALPQASSVSLVAQLMGRLTSASRASMRAETQLRVQEALNNMEPIDREVLVLRHFEMLSNDETAEILGLRKTAASNRYIRALKRLQAALSPAPGPEDVPRP